MTDAKISPLLLELYKELVMARDKYTYFLLAVAAAAVAYTTKVTTDSTLSWSMIPLGLAIICWFFSFICGCRQLHYIKKFIFAIMDYDGVKKGRINETEEKIINEVMESSLEKRESLDKQQLWFLIVGSVFFVAWHIIEMIIRTFC